MNTPTPETDAELERPPRDGDKVWVRADFARKLERERDEALRLVASLTTTAHIQASIMESELARMPAVSQRDLGEQLAAMVNRFNAA